MFAKKIPALMMSIFLLAMFTVAATAGDETKGEEKQADKGTKMEKKMEPFEYVKIITSMGDITVELNREKAPLSVNNFLGYVDENFYDNTIFHRIIPTFMIQAGGITEDMTPKKGKAPIQNECKNGLKNARGTIAMGRTNELNSATTHFYINVVDNFGLDGACYAVFGKVIDGMDVVDKIKAVKTGSKGGMRDVPVEPVFIKTVTRIDKPVKEKK